MLVEAMNCNEITTQIYNEYDKLFSTTVQRLTDEYNRERKKLKIDKARIYTRHYAVKTAGKNNWIIFIGKAPSKQKYAGPECTNVCCIVYYYNSKGLRVFSPTSKQMFMAYNCHFFKRYNERLNLKLTNSMDIMVHFFEHNGYTTQTAIEKNGCMFSIGFCKSGILLGQIQHDDKWLVWKTFVSRDLVRADQNDTEHELINNLQYEIEKEIKKETADKLKVKIFQDKMEALAGNIIE